MTAVAVVCGSSVGHIVIVQMGLWRCVAVMQLTQALFCLIDIIERTQIITSSTHVRNRAMRDGIVCSRTQTHCAAKTIK